MMYRSNSRLHVERVSTRGVVDRPDEQHEARCPPKRDDEGAEDWQSQEVRKDSVTAVSAWTLAQSGRQVAWLGVSQRYTTAIVKHLRKKNSLWMTAELQHSRKTCPVSDIWMKQNNIKLCLLVNSHEVSGVCLTVFLPDPVEELHPARQGDT